MKKSRSTRGSTRIIWPATALIVVALVLLARAPLSLDDIDEMDFLSGLSSFLPVLKTDCYGLFRPVKNLLFLAYQSLGSHAPWLWRFLTAGVYLGVTALAAALAQRLLRRRAAAFLAAVIWALAPTQVTALAWLSCFNILLQALCIFASLWFLDRSADSDKPRGAHVAAWGCGLLAMMCYEAAVALPLIALVWEVARGRGGDRARLLCVVAPLGIVALFFVLLRSAIGGASAMVNDSFAPSSDVVVVFGSAWFILQHLGQWLWPFRGPAIFGAYHAGVLTPWWFLAVCWVLLVALVVGAWLVRRRLPWVTFGLAWYLCSFLPMSNILPLRSGPIGDYFLVVPSFGLAVACAAVVSRGWLSLVSVWRLAAAVLAFIWALACHEPLRLYEYVIRGRPSAFPMRANLAREYLLANRYDEALAEARKAADQGPWYGLPHYVLGDTLRAKGDLKGARSEYEIVLKRDPAALYAHFALAFVLEQEGDLAGAETHYRAVIERARNPYTFDAAMNLGGLLAGQDRADEAIVVLNGLLAQGKSNPDLHRNLAALYHQTGDTNAVLRHMQVYRALTERP